MAPAADLGAREFDVAVPEAASSFGEGEAAIGLSWRPNVWPPEVCNVVAGGVLDQYASVCPEEAVRPGDVLVAVGGDRLDLREAPQGGVESSSFRANLSKPPVILTFRRSLLHHLQFIRETGGALYEEESPEEADAAQTSNLRSFRKMIKSQERDMHRQLQDLKTVADDVAIAAQKAEAAVAAQAAAEQREAKLRSELAISEMFRQADAADQLYVQELGNALKLSLRRDRVQKEHALLMAQITELHREEEKERQKQMRLEHETKLASLRALNAEKLARQKIMAERSRHAENMVELAAEEALREEQRATAHAEHALKRSQALESEGRDYAESGRLARVAKDAELVAKNAADGAAEHSLQVAADKLEDQLRQYLRGSGGTRSAHRLMEEVSKQAAAAQKSALQKESVVRARLPPWEQTNPNAPSLLEVSAPSLSNIAGVYRLVPGKMPNGMPLWQQQNGSSWLFSGMGGQWFFGDDEEMQNGFSRDSGLAVSYYIHNGMMPSEFGCGDWRRFDGLEYVRDATIDVRSLQRTDFGGFTAAAGSLHSSAANSPRGSPRSHLTAFDVTRRSPAESWMSPGAASVTAEDWAQQTQRMGKRPPAPKPMKAIRV
eukprot:TRINITY_DN80521_c0_g1_i1.p1 TRINITY_DN80521_c0_g1~~TRINITY_DN80521_c0_g1_i1.p1  ORF type:complete len:606 (-),score=152.26 TRINITY_DN80521_c0_g1_i1:12-1829(-)